MFPQQKHDHRVLKLHKGLFVETAAFGGYSEKRLRGGANGPEAVDTAPLCAI
jgi:hypothetical protein